MIHDLKSISEYLVEKFSISSTNDFKKALESESAILALKIEENHDEILDDIYESIEVTKSNKKFKTFLMSSSKGSNTRFMIKEVNCWVVRNAENDRKVVDWSQGIELLGRRGFEINYICLASIFEIKDSCVDSVYMETKKHVETDWKKTKRNKMENVRIEVNADEIGVKPRKSMVWTCHGCGFPNYSIDVCEFCGTILG